MGIVLFTIADLSSHIAEFGWPCGNTFIPNRSKCWTDPKTGRRLKKPINYQTYQKIQQSKSKAAQSLYKDREQAIRDKRRAAVPGWRKPEVKPKDMDNEQVKIVRETVVDYKKLIANLESQLKAASPRKKKQIESQIGIEKGNLAATEKKLEALLNGSEKNQLTDKNKGDLARELGVLSQKLPSVSPSVVIAPIASKERPPKESILLLEAFSSESDPMDRVTLGSRVYQNLKRLSVERNPEKINDAYYDFIQPLQDLEKKGWVVKAPIAWQGKGLIDIESASVGGYSKDSGYGSGKGQEAPKAKTGDPQGYHYLLSDSGVEALNLLQNKKQRSPIGKSSEGDKVRSPSTPSTPKPELTLDGNYKDPVAPIGKQDEGKIKLVDVKTAADREAYAKQELAAAKKSGDKDRIANWEKELKKSRSANIKTTQKAQEVQQTTLFNPLAYDDELNQSGLLKGLFNRRKVRIEFAGWQCGKTFIPSSRKCYTDPNTGRKTKVPITYKQYTARRAVVYKAAQRGQLPQNEYDKKLLESVSSRQAKLASQKEKLKLTKAAATAGAKQVLPSGIAEVEVDKLKVDPKRFQYKILGAQNSTGTVGSLSGVKKWDPNLAGIIQIWQDPKDRQVYVINGHNRTERAKSLGVKTMTAKFIKADSAQEARAVGALTNIAEGRGNSLDAAKFFRDSGLSKQDLENKGIPMREKIATDGLALSSLSEPLFNRVVQGTLPEQRAVTIGQSLKDHKQQQELIDLIEKEEKRGRKINNDTIAELTDMVVGAPKITESQGGLFDLLGFSPETRSLAVEKAQLQASIKRQLSREKKLFGVVGKSKAAQDLAKAGNQINVEESAQISDTAAKALDSFDKEKNLSGEVSRSINEAAERIANGENAKKVEKETYERVLASLQKTYKFGEGSSSNVAKRGIGNPENRLAASRYPTKTAEFSHPIKRRLKRRTPHYQTPRR